MNIEYYQRGLCYYGIGKYNQAIKNYLKAIEINPHKGEVFTKLGRVYKVKGNYEMAIKSFNQAIQLEDKI